MTDFEGEQDYTASVLALLAGTGIAICALLYAIKPADARVADLCTYNNDGRVVCMGGGARIAATNRGTRRKHATSRVNGASGNARRGLVTVSTAAGIDVTVAPKLAAPIQGFIADLVHERGYKPGKIKCYSTSSSHVANSLHFRGLACDFDQRGWGKTAKAMYSVSDLARKWGLRDGAEFRDWGHIDMGPHLRRAAKVRAPWPRLVEHTAGIVTP